MLYAFAKLAKVTTVIYGSCRVVPGFKKTSLLSESPACGRKLLKMGTLSIRPPVHAERRSVKVYCIKPHLLADADKGQCMYGIYSASH